MLAFRGARGVGQATKFLNGHEEPRSWFHRADTRVECSSANGEGS